MSRPTIADWMAKVAELQAELDEAKRREHERWAEESVQAANHERNDMWNQANLLTADLERSREENSMLRRQFDELTKSISALSSALANVCSR